MRCLFYFFSHNRNQNVNIRRTTSITIRTIVKKWSVSQVLSTRFSSEWNILLIFDFIKQKKLSEPWIQNKQNSHAEL